MRKKRKPPKPYSQFLLCLSGTLFFVQSCGVVSPPIAPEYIGIEAKILAQKKPAEEKFKKVEEAYYVLSNSERRKLYDEMRKLHDIFEHPGRPQSFENMIQEKKETEGEQTQNNEKSPATEREYYEVLGVSRDASGDEIKKAFRKISRQHHLDMQTYPTVTLGEGSIPLPPLQPVMSQ